MDRAKAVADMTRVLEASKGAADMPYHNVTEHRVRLYACIQRNAPHGTEYRDQMEAIRDRSDDRPALEIGDLLGLLVALRDDVAHDCLERFEERVHGEGLGGQVKSGQSWTGQIRPVAPGRVRVARDRSGLQVTS